MKNKSSFSGLEYTNDKYGGITISQNTLPKTAILLEEKIDYMIKKHHDKKLLWIKISIEKSEFIPVLTKKGFIFFDCIEDEIMLVKKLIKNPILPTPTNHTIGVGAVVIKDEKILLVKDMFSNTYKIPGGHMDKDEDVITALTREVKEETGVDIVFETVAGLGHFYPAQFSESNLYIVCKAKALTTKITIQDTAEIREAKWIDLEAYLLSQNEHVFNQKIVKDAIENTGFKLNTKQLINSSFINKLYWS